MIVFSNVKVEFGTQELYSDVNLMLGPDDRVGLVGQNGTGKSTILKLIVGDMTASAGQVQVKKNLSVAYLPQTGAKVGDHTVLEEALLAFRHLEQVHEEMIETEHKMSVRGLPQRELDALLDRYSHLQHVYEKDGYDCEARAKKVLVELGFKQEDFEKRVKTQSGGFQVRLTLARMLLQEPELLLLDEPTNYLDIRSIEWLQQYLADFKGAVLMIAHDRYLLDGLVDRIWAIENKRVVVYPGNYSDYLADKDRRDDQQQKKFEEQQALIKRTETFIAKFKGRKDTAPRAMSRQRMLDKLERVEAPVTAPKIYFQFPEAEPVYGRAFELRSVAKGFGGRQVLAHVNLAVKGGEKLGLFGANGMGKTTLLRMIAGKLNPDSGEAWWSQKTQLAYYEQGAEDFLDDSLTVLETAVRIGSGYTENQLKGILGTFLFRGDEIDKKVAVLSGGERSRLAIIRVLLTPSNLLILDEPTNHLDIQSREVLFDAMARYERTVVFAAHDRYMLDKLADKTVRVEGGEVVLFPGNYSYASAKVKAQSVKDKGQSKGKGQSPKSELRNPKSAIQNPKSKIQNPMERMVSLQRRLEVVRDAYRQAKERFELARARSLAEEERGILSEIEQLKADQVEDSVGQG